MCVCSCSWLQNQRGIGIQNRCFDVLRGLSLRFTCPLPDILCIDQRAHHRSYQIIFPCCKMNFCFAIYSVCIESSARELIVRSVNLTKKTLRCDRHQSHGMWYKNWEGVFFLDSSFHLSSLHFYPIFQEFVPFFNWTDDQTFGTYT